MLDLTHASPPEQVRVLLVGEERERSALSSLVSSWNYSVDIALDGEDAYRKMLSRPVDILLTDLRPSRTDGVELLRRLPELSDTPVAIVVSEAQQREAAMDATRGLEKVWCCSKPVEPADLRILLDRASEQRRLPGLTQDKPIADVPGLVGKTAEMQHIALLLRQVSPSRASVLITGESGTGKEVVARAIHALSGRSEGPFVAINCAAFPDGLVESELFGHEKGAFTGAVERHAGCLELANGGTLLLDEIGELPPQTQAKLLRVLDDSRVRRIGGREEIQLDVRVVSATNRNLEEFMRNGRFRQDLFYRLNVFHVAMPPLRERKEDLPVLCDALLESLNRKHDRQVTHIDSNVIECFRHYSWPGNVRELRNVLETAVIMAGEGPLATEHLPERFSPTMAAGPAPAGEPQPEQSSSVKRGVVAFPIGTTVEQAEKGLIQFTLQHTNNNKSRAAKMLGISPKTLHCKLRQYRLESQSAAAG